MLTLFGVVCLIAGGLSLFYGYGLAVRDRNPTLVWILGLLFMLLFITGTLIIVEMHK